jgi:CHRD domain-containing protein
MKMNAVATGLVFAFLGANSVAGAEELFKARLSGDNEVPPVVSDTAGRFEILVDKAATSGQYTLRVDSGVRVTQSHFHCGPAGVNGPVIVFLAGPRPEGWDVDGKWVSNATITDANVVNTACGATLAAIFEQARNGNVYVNVHSVAHPGGVARGQLEPADGN